MKIKLLLAFLVVLTSLNLSNAQSNIVKYSQVLLNDNIDELAVGEIRDGFISFAQIQTSRMDPTTKVYLCVYQESVDFNEDLILAWFENHGYTVRCSYTDVFVSGKVTSIKDTNCQ